MLESFKSRVAVATGLTALFLVTGIGAASAEPADPVITELEGMQSKVSAYGAAVVALVVVGTLIFLGIKYLRKGASKA